MNASWRPTKRHQRLIARAERRLAYWQERMPVLRNWTIRIEPAAPYTTPCGADITFWEFSREAVLRLEERMRIDDPAITVARHHLDWVIVHELCHILMNIVRGTVRDRLEEEAFRDRWNDAEEETVWNLADILIGQRS